MTYIRGANHHAPPTAVCPIVTITGSFALQGMNDRVAAHIRRSVLFSRVFEVKIAGAEHPEAINMGMKHFPDNPKFLRILSVINATLDIYPQSSKKTSNKNSTVS